VRILLVLALQIAGDQAGQDLGQRSIPRCVIAAKADPHQPRQLDRVPAAISCWWRNAVSPGTLSRRRM